MSGDYSACRALVFAKEPILGFVKTRMRSALSEQQSLALHKALTVNTCEQLAQWQVCPSDIYYWQGSTGDASSTPVFLTALSARLGLNLRPQVAGDLGEKMSAAVQSAFLEGARGVVLLGVDCPFITRDIMVALFDCLYKGADAAIVPALDGGYVALALRRYNARIFSNVCWGSERVFEQTLAHFQSLDWRYECLPALGDIDRPEDLHSLAALDGNQFKLFRPE